MHQLTAAGDKETLYRGWKLVNDLDYALHSSDAGMMGVLEENPAFLPRTSHQKTHSRRKPFTTSDLSAHLGSDLSTTAPITLIRRMGLPGQMLAQEARTDRV
jgi:hypothetical protein